MSEIKNICDNPCKNFMMYGCGHSGCTSLCHQDEEFYEKYNTPKLLAQRLKDVEKEMSEEQEIYERKLYEELKLKFG